MLILIAAGLTAAVMGAFGWALEDIARAADRFNDKADKYFEEVPFHD